MRRKIETTNGHESTLIKRERTTDLKLADFPRALAATHRGFAFYVADPISSIHGYHELGSSIGIGSQPRERNRGNGISEIEGKAARVAASESGDERVSKQEPRKWDFRDIK